jgi:TCP-1/cpn60 chaperonin family
LAKLAGGVAVIRVGGATEVEVKERKDRVEDALNATRAAVEEGISPGGGIALLRAIPALDTVKFGNPDQKTGVDIARKAIQAPARQIVDNAGADGAVVVGKLLENPSYAYGYNAQTGEYGDLVKLGIISDQGRAHGPTASGLRCRSPHHHRGDRCGSAEEGVTRHARRRHGRHGRNGLLKNSVCSKKQWRGPGFPRAFFMSARNPRTGSCATSSVSWWRDLPCLRYTRHR